VHADQSPDAGLLLHFTNRWGFGLWPLCADCVEKLENRGAPKISQMSHVGNFSRCKAL
jgi:hypothetical protein